MFIYHNSHDEKYRFPFGAVPCDSKVRLGLSVNTAKSIDSAEVVINSDAGILDRVPLAMQNRQEEYMYFYVKIDMPQEPGLLWYYFELVIGGECFYYGNNERLLGGEGHIYSTAPAAYQLTVYKGAAKTPDWYKKAIMYQIFVDRFFNGNKDGKVLNPKKNSFIYANWEDTPTYIKDCEEGSIDRWDFFGGNLQGIIEKLSYLKELGVSVLYLNPVFEASSNHKYDTADYKNIDPMFGDNDTFKALCHEAGQLGIAVMLDGVFSHTGSDSIYFNRYGRYSEVGAYQSTESKYRPWYRFKNACDEYECWWGVESLPNVNEMDPSYIDYIITGESSVIKHWMGLGAKGWRLDVADELPDEFIKLLHETIKEKDEEAMLMGEVWEDASNKVSYGKRRAYLLGDELDCVMNYPFRGIMIDFFTGKHDAKAVNEALMNLYENYPLHNFYCNMNLIGTHDVPRILTMLGEAPEEQHLTKRQKEEYRLPESQKTLGVARLKLLILIQMTFPGVPSIYYGDEAGMEGYRDPLNRGAYPWGKENMELLDWYKRAAGIRSSHTVFSTGKWIPIYAEGDVYGYIRKAENNTDIFGEHCEDNTAIVLVNRNKAEKCRVLLDLGAFCKGKIYDLLDNNKEVNTAGGSLDIVLEPLQGKIFIEKP